MATFGTPSALPQDGFPDILTSTASGAARAALFSGAPGHTLFGRGAPFGDGFRGGMRVAMGDVTADGVADFIVAMGPGTIGGSAPIGGLVQIYNGFDVALVGMGFPFGAGFTGGVWLASGDVDRDGRDDVILSEGAGGRVLVFSLAGTPTLLANLTPYGPAFTGGVRVAAGDVDGDGRADVITAPATGVGPVRIFSGGVTPAGELVPFDPGFAGGVFVAAGDVTGDGRADIIASTSGGAGHIRVFNGATAGLLHDLGPLPFPAISVAAADLTGDGRAEIIGGVGPGGPPIVGILDGATLALLASFGAEAPSFGGGILVSAPPRHGIEFVSEDEATFLMGTAGTFTVTTRATPPVTTIAQAGTLPPGVAFVDNHDGTASLTGTVPAGSGGNFGLTFTASNGVAPPVQQTFTLHVNGPPQITSANAVTFNIGGPNSFTVTTTGFPAPTLTLSGTLPGGVTFTNNGNGTATLAGSPQSGTSGAYPLTITATNGVGTAATQAFTLTLNPAPTFSSANSAVFGVGSAATFTITATGDPLPTIAQTGALPAGVTFTNNGNGTATLAGTPAGGSQGLYPLILTASNGSGPDAVQNFTLRVNLAPAITSPNSTTFVAGTPGAFTVTATGFPAPTISATGALPAGVAFNAATSTLEGTPMQTGTFASIQFRAANGVNPDALQSFSLTVTCPAITIGSTPATVPNGVFNLPYAGATFNQVGGGPGTWSASGLPPGLAVNPGTGALAGTPTTTGVFNGIVTYTNAAGCQGAANMSIAIAPNPVIDEYDARIGNTQMVAAGHSAPATPFVPFISSLIANDGGPAGTLAVTPVTNAPTAAGGLITIDALGRFTYTPPTGAIGVDSFAYTVTSNGVGAVGIISLGIGTERLWYVNAAAAPGGSGASHSPFNSMTSVNAAGGAGDADDAGDFIYVYPGTYPSGYESEIGQTLWGAGSVFNPVVDLVIPAATAPTLQGTVTIATDNVAISSINIATAAATGITNTAAVAGLTIKNGVTVTTTTGTAVAFSSVNSTAGEAPNFGVNFRSVSSTGATTAISLLNVNQTSGTFRITGDGASSGSGGTIQNTSGDAIALSAARNVRLGYMTIVNAGGDAIDLGNADGTYAIDHMVIAGSVGHAINVATSPLSANTTTVQLRIENNSVGSAGVVDSGSRFGSGIRVGMLGQARGIVLVNNNVIHQVPNARAIEIVRQDPGAVAGAQAADVTVTNNTVTAPTGTTATTPCGVGVVCPAAAFYFAADDFGTGQATILNIDVRGNVAYDPIAAFPGQGAEGAYRVAEVAGGALNVVGNAANAATQIAGTNVVTAPASGSAVNVDAGVTLIPGPIVTPP